MINVRFWSAGASDCLKFYYILIECHGTFTIFKHRWNGSYHSVSCPSACVTLRWAGKCEFSQRRRVLRTGDSAIVSAMKLDCNNNNNDICDVLSFCRTITRNDRDNMGRLPEMLCLWNMKYQRSSLKKLVRNTSLKNCVEFKKCNNICSTYLPNLLGDFMIPHTWSHIFFIVKQWHNP